MRLNNPTINQYFQGEDIAPNSRYITGNKLYRNIGILSMNPYEYRLNDEDKIHKLIQLIQKYNIHIILLQEINTKRDTVNISKMERHVKR